MLIFNIMSLFNIIHHIKHRSRDCVLFDDVLQGFELVLGCLLFDERNAT